MIGLETYNHFKIERVKVKIVYKIVVIGLKFQT